MAISIERLKASPVGLLALLNVIVFLGLHVSSVVCNFIGNDAGLSYISSWLACPSSFATLVVRPWSVVTYCFTQYDTLHAILNILWLVWFGSLAAYFNISPKRIIILYLAAGIVGAAFYIVSSELSGVDNAFLLGSSASVLAIATSVAVIRPKTKVRIPLLPDMPLYIPVMIIVLVQALLVANGNLGGHFAHIGGIFAGIISGLVWKKKTVVAASHQFGRNTLEDKIFTSGFDSLTQEERKTLLDDDDINFQSSSKL